MDLKWEGEIQANDIKVVGQKWVKEIQEAPAKDKENVKQRAKQALDMAKVRRAELRSRHSMSDKDVLTA